MRRQISFAFLFLLLYPLLLPCSLAKAEDAPRVMIEEVAWAGSSLSTADEWIELANLDAIPASVGGWTLRGAGTSGRTITLPADTEIPAFGTYLIANYAEADEKSALAVHVDVATTTVSLSNSALGIELRDAGNIIIDRAGDETSPFAGSSSPLSSIVRTNAETAGDSAEGWMSAEKSAGYKDGITDQGTPGFCDLCSPISLAIVESAEETPIDSSGSEEEVPMTEIPIEETSSPETPDETTQAPDQEILTEEYPIQSDLENEYAETETKTETSATSTDPVIEIVDTAASSTLSTAEATSQTDDLESASCLIPVPLSVFLNEAVSNPASGKEWVELRWEDGATSTDRALFLYDGQGKIATVATGTALTAPPYLVIELASAKLNNSGDTLSIREADGTIIEQTSVPALDKGESWARNMEQDAWDITETVTPAAENIIYIYVAPKSSTISSSSLSSSSSSPDNTTLTTNATSTTTTTSAATSTNTTNATPALPKLAVTLNETVSNPISGPEWVELRYPDGTPETDRDLVLKDGQGKIASVTKGTPLTATPYLVVPLKTARLNNSGDTLSLVETDGVALDATEIPELKKGESWGRDVSGAWHVMQPITPGAPNHMAGNASSASSTEAKADDDAAMEQEDATAEAEMLDDIFTSASIATNAESSSSKKKVKTDIIQSYPFDAMYDVSLNAARVRISGTVASVPRLLGASHTMVLQNEDGRGLLVYLPAHLNLPPLGSTIQIDGTLSTTYQGPELRMKKTDIWITMATGTPPVPRTADMLAPDAEDAWSLVEIKGSVATVGASSFVVQTDESMDVTISVPSPVKFRTKRLVKGDTVRVIGLLNIRKDVPTVIPRTADDIAILSHASDSISPPSDKGASGRFPDWVPFASAGGAIIAVGGAKRAREMMRKRTLKKIMEAGKIKSKLKIED